MYRISRFRQTGDDLRISVGSVLKCATSEAMLWQTRTCWKRVMNEEGVEEIYFLHDIVSFSWVRSKQEAVHGGALLCGDSPSCSSWPDILVLTLRRCLCARASRSAGQRCHASAGAADHRVPTGRHLRHNRLRVRPAPQRRGTLSNQGAPPPLGCLCVSSERDVVRDQNMCQPENSVRTSDLAAPNRTKVSRDILYAVAGY